MSLLETLFAQTPQTTTQQQPTQTTPQSAGNGLGGLPTNPVAAVADAVTVLVQTFGKVFFTDHSPAYYFDQSTDNWEKFRWAGYYVKNHLATPSQMAARYSSAYPNLNEVRDAVNVGIRAIKALAANADPKQSGLSYKSGLVMYYLPLYAFGYTCSGYENYHADTYVTNVTLGGDIELQKLCCLLYCQGQLVLDGNYKVWGTNKPQVDNREYEAKIKSCLYYAWAKQQIEKQFGASWDGKAFVPVATSSSIIPASVQAAVTSAPVASVLLIGALITAGAMYFIRKKK